MVPATVVGVLVMRYVVLEGSSLDLGEALVSVQVSVTLNNHLSSFACEIYLTETVINESVRPIIHEFTIYPKVSQSQTTEIWVSLCNPCPRE